MKKEIRTKFMVKYKVVNFGDKEHQAGPYDHEWIAQQNLEDIRGYEGVHSAHIVPVKVAE